MTDSERHERPFKSTVVVDGVPVIGVVLQTECTHPKVCGVCSICDTKRARMFERARVERLIRGVRQEHPESWDVLSALLNDVERGV